MTTCLIIILLKVMRLYRRRDGWTALMLATREGYVDAVAMLVESGANADIVSV
jgi:ankyrin repeat protein